MGELKQKTVKGTVWSAVERFSVQGVQFIVMIVMARILTPEDYGLVGMLAIFLAVSQSLIDSGFSQALIRKMDRTETDNCTVFYFNIVVGLVLYLILYAFAPLVAKFYDAPTITSIMRVICISVIINSLVVVQRALYTVNIDFKTQAKASLSAAIVSGIIGITMAYKGFEVWSIVTQQLTNLGVNAGLLWFFSKWRPRLLYSWKSFRELFSFGSKLMLSGLLDTLYKNIYTLVIGKVFNASSLGHYTRAHQFADFPSSNLTGIMQRVTYPVLCNIQEDDERLKNVYRRFLKLSAFIIFPLMLGLSAVSEPFVEIFIGKQWSYCSSLLQILCFSMMWFPIHAINLNLLQVKGRSDLFLRLEVIKKTIGIAILCVTIPMGLTVMCFGQIISSIVALIINTYYTGKLIDIGFFKQMKDLLPITLLSLAMFAVVLAVVNLIDDIHLQLVCGIIVGTATYISASILFKFNEINELKALITRK